MERRDKINYYLDIAEAVTGRGTCLRRNFGAVIVKNDTIISTGYVGAPRGRANCNELHYCTREKLQVPRGERYELCRSVHAEQNAIINASRSEMLGATLYLVGLENRTGGYVEAAAPCSLCKRMIINAGIERVIVRDTRDTYRTFEVDEEWVAHEDSLEGIKGYYTGIKRPGMVHTMGKTHREEPKPCRRKKHPLPPKMRSRTSRKQMRRSAAARRSITPAA